MKQIPAGGNVTRISVDDDPEGREHELYRFLVESLTEYAVFAVSPGGVIVSWNSGAQKIFGYTPAEIIGRPLETIFTAADIALDAPRTELTDALRGGRLNHDRWHVRKDGGRFWGTNTVQPLYDRTGTLQGFTKLVRDTTEIHAASEELSDSEQQLRLLVESVRDYAIFSTDVDGMIKTWSAGAQSVFGYTPADIIGRNFSVLFRAADAGFANEELRAAARGTLVNVERWLVRKNGQSFLASGTTSKLAADAAGTSRGFVKIVHDTTAEHAAAEDLRRKALVDPLTELPNRRTFYDHVQRAISFFKRRSANSFAVLFVDLDHFKAVNDEFGHTLADNVLRTIARRLESCVRSGDIVARVGGDEFSILLNGLGGQLDADDAAQRILHVMQQAISTDVGDVFAAVSVGIAIGTAKYERPEEVMQDADAAMYVAKTQGRARAVVFDDSMATVARDNLVLTTALRHAIERNELRLAYQPVLRLCDMKPVGFEALVRWRHPRRGLLVPGEFMPQAEESNLVFAVDRWVLTQVCGQIVNWRTRGIITPGFQISINVSSKEFTRDEFADEVRAILRHQDVDPTTLRFEITENTLFERSLRAYANLAAVRAIGIKVDVDDFGTGYASLRSLNDISVDGLKIDWSFITSRHGQHGWEIAESVISLAHKLGLIAIAEGIESATQFERLLALGCDFGQGYLFAPALGPVAAAAFARDGFSLHSTTPL